VPNPTKLEGLLTTSKSRACDIESELENGVITDWHAHRPRETATTPNQHLPDIVEHYGTGISACRPIRATDPSSMQHKSLRRVATGERDQITPDNHSTCCSKDTGDSEPEELGREQSMFRPRPQHNHMISGPSALAQRVSPMGNTGLPVRDSWMSMPVMPIIAARPLLRSAFSFQVLPRKSSSSPTCLVEPSPSHTS